jgi:hypothetical protein
MHPRQRGGQIGAQIGKVALDRRAGAADQNIVPARPRQPGMTSRARARSRRLARLRITALPSFFEQV